jgi:hypothetical protein
MVINKDIQDLTPDERVMVVLRSVDDMLSKFAEQEHIVEAVKTGAITPKVVDPNLTEHLITSLRWITANLELDVVDKFINQSDFENPEVIKSLLREGTFNVNMYH